MSFLKNSTFKILIINIAVIFLILILLLLAFFFIYLPATTKHGESITVPELTGKSFEEARQFLQTRNLRFEVMEDSAYSPVHSPLTVLKQYPAAGKKVKEERKIYLTLNRESIPHVKMPKLVGTSVKNAQLVLKSFDLQAEVRYVPNIFPNLVLSQKIDGKEISEGTYVTVGSKILLEVGDGEGETEFDVPILINMMKDDAEITLLGSGLKIGTIRYEDASGKQPGTVTKQDPMTGKIRAGETVDIWIIKDNKENEIKL